MDGLRGNVAPPLWNKRVHPIGGVMSGFDAFCQLLTLFLLSTLHAYTTTMSVNMIFFSYLHPAPCCTEVNPSVQSPSPTYPLLTLVAPTFRQILIYDLYLHLSDKSSSPHSRYPYYYLHPPSLMSQDASNDPPHGLYRRWEASRDPWRHPHLATSGKSVEGSRNA